MTDKDPPILLDTIQQNMSFKKDTTIQKHHNQPFKMHVSAYLTLLTTIVFTVRQALFMLLLLLGNSKFLFTSNIGNTFSH